jgi:hypothetical protein
MYRQGDVLVVPCDSIPDDLEKIEEDNNRIVLAYGEATGHAHAIHKNSFLFRDKISNKFYLIVTKPTELVHEEHDTINLPIGNYEVIRQRFYTPERIKYVAD